MPKSSKMVKSKSLLILRLFQEKSLFRILIWLLIFGAVWACNPVEEEISSDPNLKLTYWDDYSEIDTVKFDTLLTSVGSITHRFKIKNPNQNAILIENIHLGLGDNSEYSIAVNGAQSASFQNEVVLGYDSILVLVEVFIDPMNLDLPFIVKDSVVINYNNNTDDVKLVAWGQDANFIDSEVLTCDAVWDSPKPYVIYNYAIVDTLCTLSLIHI